MPRAICRCGQELPVPTADSDRVVCPRCGSRVRVRVNAPAADGYIRFVCPCGRRLKVDAANPPPYGKCPDCGEVIPVPPAGASPAGSAFVAAAETRTAEIDPADLARLEQWSRAHAQKRAPAAAPAAPLAPSPSASNAGSAGSGVNRQEAGLRVCPNCRKPIHLSADACRHCGTHVPKR